MKALAEPSRIKIAKALQGGPLCVCELTQLLVLSQPSVSKHAKVLEQAGLIVGTRRGPWVWYERAYDSKILALLDELLHNDIEAANLSTRAEQVRLKRKDEQVPAAGGLRCEKAETKKLETRGL